MKSILTFVVALAMVLMLSACSQEPAPAEKKEETAVQIPKSPTEPSQQMAEKAEKEMQEMTASAREQAEQAATTVKEGAAEVAEKTEAVVSEAAKETKEMASEAAKETEQAASAVAQEAKEVMAPATGPTVVEYPASMGKVTFNHAEHAGKLDCSKCHPTDPPEKIAIDKEVAHNQLCKVCHKESGGNAPTACAGCHKK